MHCNQTEISINRRHSKLDLESSTSAVAKQPQPTLKILNQVQDDLSITTRNGFTLIEMLVVVLIIGILAAVAVPQYQKAVIKAKLANARTLLKSVVQAQEGYYLANGQYATQLNQLDIDIPNNGTCPNLGDICVTLTDYYSSGWEHHLYGVRASLKEPTTTSNGYIYFLNDGPGVYANTFPKGMYCTDTGSSGYCTGSRISSSFYGLGMFKDQ